MPTFSNWVAEQSHRDDAVGYFANYWSRVTPGRISSITGIGRHLDKLDAAYRDSDDEKGKAALGAARSGYELAVKDYHKAEATANAVRTGALTDRVPDVPASALQDAPGPYPGERDPFEDRQPYELAADAAGLPQIRRAGRDAPDDRLAAVERLCGEILAALDYRVGKQVGELLAHARLADERLAVIEARLAPEMIDWEASWDAWLALEAADAGKAP